MSKFRTNDGLLVSVRPMQTDDTPLLVEIFGHMGSESRYSRFYESVDNADEGRIWEEAERIAHGIGPNSFGMLAFADRPELENAPVAGIRWVRSGPDEAELAVSVTDEFQGHGIGSHLVGLLAEQARASGIKRLTGSVQSENAAAWGMLRKLPYEVQRDQEGSVTNIVVNLIPD